MNAARFAILFAALSVVPAWAALDPHTPSDTQIYVAIDVRTAFDSEFFKDNVLGPARDLLKQIEGADKVLEELGLDPFKDIDRLVIATPTTKDNDRGLLVAYGRFDPAKFGKRVDRLKRDSDESIKLHEIPLGAGAKHTVYEVAIPGTEMAVFVALKDGKTLLVSPGKDYIVDALKATRAGTKPSLKNKDLEALIARLEVSKRVLTVAMPGSALVGVDDLIPGAAEALKGIEAIGGGLTIGKEVEFDLAISTTTDENAQQIRSTLEKGTKLATAGLALLGEDRKDLTLLFEVVKSIKVIGKGKVVGVSARVTADTLQDLFGKGG